MWNDTPAFEQVDTDAIAHSPQAMKVLLEKGTDAYHRFVAEARKLKK